MQLTSVRQRVVCSAGGSIYYYYYFFSGYLVLFFEKESRVTKKSAFALLEWQKLQSELMGSVCEGLCKIRFLNALREVCVKSLTIRMVAQACNLG